MNKTKPYNGVLGFDRLPQSAKIASWLLSMMLLIPVQMYPYYRIMSTSAFPFSFTTHLLKEYFNILGSMCLVVVWLRLTGIRWRYILFFPITMLIGLTPLVIIMTIVSA